MISTLVKMMSNTLAKDALEISSLLMDVKINVESVCTLKGLSNNVIGNSFIISIKLNINPANSPFLIIGRSMNTSVFNLLFFNV